MRCSEDIFFDSLDSATLSAIANFLTEIETGSVARALEILKPLIEEDNPAALFYASGVSAESIETLEQFETRHIRQLKKSAELGYAPALHKLAICYDNGDPVPRDTGKAAQLFRQAAEKGHPHAQWIYGVDLLRGQNGIEKNEVLGLTYIEKAADAKFEGALETMFEFYKNGTHGFPADASKAKSYMNKIKDEDALGY